MIELKEYKQYMTADESFNMRVENCRKLMTAIGKKITEIKTEQRKEKKNWSYSASMGYVQEKLEEIYQFLYGEELYT